MSRRIATNVVPFEFRSDFDTAQKRDDQVTLSAAELAALLDDARRSTAELLRDEQVQLQADTMRESSETLRAALTQIVALAELLESSALSADTKTDALSRVRALAAEIIDGQRNLFHP